MQIYKRVYKKTNSIEGWFSFEAAMLIGMINSIQRKNNINGDIFEIGVHHGKSSVFFANLINDDEILTVCDLFDIQDQNVSASGKGDYEIFLNNIKRYSSITPVIHKKSSLELTSSEIGKSYRIFHIDGGHSADETFNDLTLASNAITEKAVIIIDDPMTYEWPGVAEGIIRFLDSRNNFVPLAAGFNKMIIADRKFADIYTGYFDNADYRFKHNLFYPIQMKKLEFADFPMRIFYIPGGINPNTLLTKFKRFIKKQTHLNNPAFNIFKRFYK